MFLLDYLLPVVLLETFVFKKLSIAHHENYLRSITKPGLSRKEEGSQDSWHPYLDFVPALVFRLGHFFL